MTVPPCRSCGRDTAVLEQYSERLDRIMPTVLCTGCGDTTRRCTCPPLPTRQQ